MFSVFAGSVPFSYYISLSMLRQVAEINTPKRKKMKVSLIGTSSEIMVLQVYYKGILHLTAHYPLDC